MIAWAIWIVADALLVPLVWWLIWRDRYTLSGAYRYIFTLAWTSEERHCRFHERSETVGTVSE